MKSPPSSRPHRSLSRLRRASGRLALLLVLAAPAHAATARGRAAPDLATRIGRLIDHPPFDRGTWAVLVVDSSGKTIYERNADRLMIPASNNKLIVTSTALALLGPSYRVMTSAYGTGPVENGVLRGDLVAYGRGDPTFSEHCYDTGGTAGRSCDSLWASIDALADSVIARGVRRISGAIVGDGSCFEERLVNGEWEQYDLNWWYAAPVSGLGFNDNSVDITWKPSTRVGTPPVVSFHPSLDFVTFENRGVTTPAGGDRTLEYYRKPGTNVIWSEGNVPLGDDGLTEYFALPDPNFYFAHALRMSLARKGVTVSGPTQSTTDSTRYRDARGTAPLATHTSRPVSDIVFPILNTSQNWFAEMLLKMLGKERGGVGSWEQGVAVERRFLIDSVGVDSEAFATVDGSGLAKGNLVTPRALTQILRYVRRRPEGAAFLRAMPRSGQPGSLRQRFTGTPIEGRVVAKTGGVSRVSSLSGYIERPGKSPLVFSVIVNNYAGPAPAPARIDSVVVEMAR